MVTNETSGVTTPATAPSTTEPGTAIAPPATIAVPVELFDEISSFVRELENQFSVDGWPLTPDEQARLIRSIAHKTLKLSTGSKALALLRLERALQLSAERTTKDLEHSVGNRIEVKILPSSAAWLIANLDLNRRTAS